MMDDVYNKTLWRAFGPAAIMSVFLIGVKLWNDSAAPSNLVYNHDVAVIHSAILLREAASYSNPSNYLFGWYGLTNHMLEVVTPSGSVERSMSDLWYGSNFCDEIKTPHLFREVDRSAERLQDAVMYGDEAMWIPPDVDVPALFITDPQVVCTDTGDVEHCYTVSQSNVVYHMPSYRPTNAWDLINSYVPHINDGHDLRAEESLGWSNLWGDCTIVTNVDTRPISSWAEIDASGSTQIVESVSNICTTAIVDRARISMLTRTNAYDRFYRALTNLTRTVTYGHLVAVTQEFYSADGTLSRTYSATPVPVSRRIAEAMQEVERTNYYTRASGYPGASVRSTASQHRRVRHGETNYIYAASVSTIGSITTYRLTYPPKILVEQGQVQSIDVYCAIWLGGPLDVSPPEDTATIVGLSPSSRELAAALAWTSLRLPEFPTLPGDPGVYRTFGGWNPDRIYLNHAATISSPDRWPIEFDLDLRPGAMPPAPTMGWVDGDDDRYETAAEIAPLFFLLDVRWQFDYCGGSAGQIAPPADPPAEPAWTNRARLGPAK